MLLIFFPQRQQSVPKARRFDWVAAAIPSMQHILFFCCILENSWGNLVETLSFGKLIAGVVGKRCSNRYLARAHSETCY